jgi:citrate synthase
MTGIEMLQAAAGRIKSRMGRFFPGERVVFRGQNLHRDLKGIDWVELYLFSITGRRFTPEQVRLLHMIWVHTSYPDARIWNNRVVALAGSARSSSTLALSAGLAVSEAQIYGRGVDHEAISFLIETRRRLDQGATLADCVQSQLAAYRRIAGYGRPIINGDERIKPTMALAGELGLDKGPHLALIFEVENYLVASRYRMKMNYGAIAAALGADLGLSPREYTSFMFPAFLAGMPPCYIEAGENPEGALFPVPCDAILYEGVGKRAWPGRAV